MANNWFAFKQFKVVQERAAMKVGTDGVLLGVCVPDGDYRQILDVGTGTGLVALMMAQRFANSVIDAVEIDHDAGEEAHFNFQQSPWSSRLSLIHADVRSFSTANRYDLIVSNPPYFVDSLKNDCHKRKMARHTDSLTTMELLELVARILSPTGSFVVILPHLQHQDAVNAAAHQGLRPWKTILVKPRADKPYKRVIIIFTFSDQGDGVFEELMIENTDRHQYTTEFLSLTKPFYLEK
ncbi:MAG: methyltransferase [Breznakibacter sp.]|nr:methyltransferase [Breznakibacter sp.]